MAKQNEFSWSTKNKTKIYAYHWEADEPQGVICLVHGLGEHCRRYDHMAAFYNQNGYSVMSFDNIGHGKSGGKRGHTPTYQIFLDNIDELLKVANKTYPLLPKFIYGHSLGGNMALTYTLKKNPSVAGLITTGAFITLPQPAPKLLVGFGKIMRNIIPSLLQSNNLNAEHISSNPEEVQKYLRDPLVHDRLSVNMGIEILEAGKWLEHYKGKVELPILLMHGGEDYITSPEGSSLMTQNLDGDVVAKIWDGMYHEIHNEPDQQEVFNYTLNWIEQKIVKWSEKAT